MKKGNMENKENIISAQEQQNEKKTASEKKSFFMQINSKLALLSGR